MGKGRTVIHCNSRLSHQVDYAQALAAGIPGAEISYSPDTPADTHIVIGPHFAKWPDALMLDRAYWGDPDCVSVHWLKDGEKVRTTGNPYRAHPDFMPYKVGNREIYLCDYGEKWGLESDITVRYHPAQSTPRMPLMDELERHDIATGRRTTALVDAALMGLEVRTDDPHSPVWPIRNKTGDREQWLRDLAWHNWSKDEIINGSMWNAFS